MMRQWLLGSVICMCGLVGAHPARAEAPVVTDAQPSALSHAEELDRLAQGLRAQARCFPVETVSDATFARRAYLVLAGRIPTAEELVAFLHADGSTKRGALLDQLLQSPGYESRMFNFWADLLRARSRNPGGSSGAPYLHWIKQRVADRTAYDVMVRELLTATGPSHAPGNGATGYMLRDANMLEDGMANTVRTFLGESIECAQCHDHPFDDFTRKQYHRMVAFSGGVRFVSDQHEARIDRLRETAQARWGKKPGARATNRALGALVHGVSGTGNAAYLLPLDYQYPDGEALAWVGAETALGPTLTLTPAAVDDRRIRKRREDELPKLRNLLVRRFQPEDVGSRAAFARWLTSDDNTGFAETLASRLWEDVYGYPLVAPVGAKKAVVQAFDALRVALASVVRSEGYRLDSVQRVLLSMKLFAAPSTTAREPQLDPALTVRRISAEAAWDSLVTLTVEDVDAHLEPPQSAKARAIYHGYEEIHEASDAELLARIESYLLRDTDREQFAKKRQAEKKRNKLRTRDIEKKYAEAEAEDDVETMARLRALAMDEGLRDPARERVAASRRRASDLASPAPEGHLLRDLGQSDRSVLDGARREATVPQVLALLNGFLEESILHAPKAHLMRQLEHCENAAQRIQLAFLSVLSRKPTAAERARWTQLLADHPEQGTDDLVWTLVNSHEFLFMH